MTVPDPVYPPVNIPLVSVEQALPEWVLLVKLPKSVAFPVDEKVIKSINPQNVLDRGYSLRTHIKGDVIKDSAQIIEGEEITAKLAKGSFEAKVGKKNV